MQYAKVNNNTVIKFPYYSSDLHKENPHTAFDSKYSLEENFAKTQAAIRTGDTVVAVAFLPCPKHDQKTHYVNQKTFPELVENVWVFPWEVLENAPFSGPDVVNKDK